MLTAPGRGGGACFLKSPNLPSSSRREPCGKWAMRLRGPSRGLPRLSHPHRTWPVGGSAEVLAPFFSLSLCSRQNSPSPHLLPYACSPCPKRSHHFYSHLASKSSSPVGSPACWAVRSHPLDLGDVTTEEWLRGRPLPHATVVHLAATHTTRLQASRVPGTGLRVNIAKQGNGWFHVILIEITSSDDEE